MYYVDGANGDDEDPGLTIATAVKTIANALTKSSNLDTLELAAGTYSGTDNLTGQGEIFYMEPTTADPTHKRSCIWVSVEPGTGTILSLVTYVPYWIDNRGRFE